MAALDAYEADLGPHGQLMSEATSRDADPGNPNRKYRYVAGPEGADGLPIVDWAARERERASKEYYDNFPDEGAGHLWVVRKVKA